MQDDLVAGPNVLATIHAMKPVRARTLEFAVTHIGDSSDVTRQRDLRERLNDFAGLLNRGFAECGTALDIEQLFPFRQAKEFTAVKLRTLAIPADSVSCQQEPSGDEPRVDTRPTQLANQSSNFVVELGRFLEDGRLVRFQERSIPMLDLNHKEPAGANGTVVFALTCYRRGA